MTSRRLFIAVCWAVTGVACAAEPPSAETRTLKPLAGRNGGNDAVHSGSARAPAGLRTAPLTVELQGPDRVQSGAVFDVTLRITRAPWVRVPLDLRVTVPPGVTLLQGETRERIGTAGTLVLRTLRLRTARVPEHDLIVEVDARSAGFGAHSVQRFRFGRAAPALPAPPRTAPARLNGRELGRAIPLRSDP